MSFVDIEGSEQRNILDTLYQNKPDLTAFDPQFVRAGDILEPFKGAAQAVNKASLFAADTFTPMLLGPARSLDSLLGGDNAEHFLLNEQQKVRDSIKLMRPDPVNTGVVGNVLNSVVDIGGTALIGTALSGGDPAGGAALVGVTNAYSSYVEGTEEQGLDPKTAGLKAALEGGTLAAGVKIPAAFGPNILKNTLLYGPAVNTVLGVAQRGATSELLRANGYNEQADQYQWLDSKAMVIDAVLGSAFGYIGAKSHIKLNREMLPSDIEAALSGNKDYHMEVDSAPGVPVDGPSRQAHLDAINKSIDDMLNDRPVDVGSIVRDAEFIKRRDSATVPREIKDALDTVGQGHIMDELVPGKKVESMTLDEMRRELLRDPLTGIGNRRAFEESVKLPVRGSIDADGLKWINDNLGHETGDQMLKTIGRALAQETKQAYRIGGDEFTIQAHTLQEAETLLQRATKRLEDAVIKVKTPDGGTVEVKGVKLSYGIGKTTNEAEARLQSHKLEREQSGLRTPRGSEPAGVTRTPPEGKQSGQGDAATQGGIKGRVGQLVQSVKEAVSPKKETAPSANELEQLYLSDSKYRDALNDMAMQHFEREGMSVSNSDVKDWIRSFNQDFSKAIGEGKADSFIEKETFGRLDLSKGVGDQGNVGHYELATSRTNANELLRIARQKLIPELTSDTAIRAEQQAKTKAEAKSPEVTAAEQALAEHPDIEIQTENGPVKASELLARADEEISRAQKESSAFEVAVNCFLRYGS